MSWGVNYAMTRVNCVRKGNKCITCHGKLTSMVLTTLREVFRSLKVKWYERKNYEVMRLWSRNDKIRTSAIIIKKTWSKALRTAPFVTSLAYTRIKKKNILVYLDTFIKILKIIATLQQNGCVLGSFLLKRMFTVYPVSLPKCTLHREANGRLILLKLRNS